MFNGYWLTVIVFNICVISVICVTCGRYAQNLSKIYMKFLFQDYRFQKFQKQRKKRKSETRAFLLSHGAVVNPMREVHRRLGGENHGDIKNQKISVKSVLSV